MTILKYIGTWEELEKRGFEKQKDKWGSGLANYNRNELGRFV